MVLTLPGLTVVPLAAQTIRGTLMEVGTDRPVPTADLFLLRAESGDTVAAATTDASGAFALTAPEPGSCRLRASAVGYRPRTAGVFELGRGGEMTVEFRVPPQPFPIEVITVEGEASILEPALARTGFYDRMEVGFGHFITPEDIRTAPPGHIEDLFLGIPNVFVSEGRVRMRSAGGGFCDPGVFVDGIRAGISGGYSRGITLDMVVTRESVMAVEVYKRSVEIPLQFSGGVSGASTSDPASGCGVIVLWTKG